MGPGRGPRVPDFDRPEPPIHARHNNHSGHSSLRLREAPKMPCGSASVPHATLEPGGAHHSPTDTLVLVPRPPGTSIRFFFRRAEFLLSLCSSHVLGTAPLRG